MMIKRLARWLHRRYYGSKIAPMIDAPLWHRVMVLNHLGPVNGFGKPQWREE